MLQGGCFCGYIRYRATGTPSLESHCHCSMCRRVSGAAFVTWFTVRAEEFNFDSGTPTRFASSEHAERTFCPRCGTPLTFHSSRFPDEIDITLCSLDDPEQLQPKDHTHTSSQLSWVKLDDGLPRFSEERR